MRSDSGNRIFALGVTKFVILLGGIGFVAGGRKMAAGQTRRITAASARAHTRKPKPKATSSATSGWFTKMLLIGFVGLSAWAYQATKPPPPKICGSAGGPPVTASRIRLDDGRHLAYEEFGVPKDIAKHKIVFIHGFDSCRHDVSAITANLSPDLVQSKGIYIVSFDRPGYGESDPHPTRTVKSLAFDIEALADKLELGSKFYIVGFSMGGQISWACLKHIPHRLAGAALVAPAVNFWWRGIPSNVSQQGFELQPAADRWVARVAHYVPWLTYWWNTQKLFASSSVIARSASILSNQDKELLPRILEIRKEYLGLPRQQGEFESLHRDAIVAFGKWEFSPVDLENPFAESEGSGSVQLWQGEEDVIVPVTLQRYIASQLPWIRYHEVPGAGHLLPFADGMADTIIKSLVA
ncbi:uncharacterized protein LOC127250958 isoform X2 [Andrographis paniculata]|uniref:uncharacterized protein LOC127250958 isoform X2 n=1 Tax=Andrographis paniculata TaxID=175694 RepID=UPI0021E77B22|nr:uncharacterized protein LOC127250958 isoform X2 [Andrographis paniculata]